MTDWNGRQFLRRDWPGYSGNASALGVRLSRQFLFFIRAKRLVGLPCGRFLTGCDQFGLSEIQPGLCSLVLTQCSPVGHATMQLSLFIGGKLGIAGCNSHPFPLLRLTKAAPVRGQGFQRDLLGDGQFVPKRSGY